MLAAHEGGDRVLTLAPVVTAGEILAAQEAAIARARRRAAARLRRCGSCGVRARIPASTSAPVRARA